jgi:hypothetical protein
MRVLAFCLLTLCACKNVDVPWQRPACAALQLSGDPPDVASLIDVRASGDSVLALWRGLEDPGDPLLLSIFDGQRWHQPYRLLEHSSDLQRTAISNAGVLLFSVDYDSVERAREDAGVGEPDADAGQSMESTSSSIPTYETQLTLVNDACNEVPLTKVRANPAYAAVTLANSGLAAAAWSDDESAAQAVVVRAAQEPRRTTLAKASEDVTRGIAGLTALSDNSMIATLIERGPRFGDPQRLLTRRYWLQWQQPVEHYATDELDGVDFTGLTIAAGAGSTAALSWVTSTASKAELRMQRTEDGTSWSDPVVLYSDELTIVEPQSIFAADGSRLALIWRGDNDAWRALIIEGDEPIGEAVDTGCSDRHPPSALFDPRDRLLIACGNDEGPATLSSFDGTSITFTQLGNGDGAATQPKLTAVPAGGIMALWEQHDGSAYNTVGDMGVRTPSSIVSALIVGGELQRAQAIIP